MIKKRFKKTLLHKKRETILCSVVSYVSKNQSPQRIGQHYKVLRGDAHMMDEMQAGEWFLGEVGSSKIPRLYHNERRQMKWLNKYL